MKNKKEFLFFHSLFLNIVIINLKFINSIETLRKKQPFNKNRLHEILKDEKLIESLLQQSFIINHNINELQNFIQKRKTKKDQLIVKKLCLVVTKECNFKCKYCTIVHKRRSSENQKMSYFIAKKAVDLFFKTNSPDNHSGIVFYGGEPLLEKRLIIKTAHYIRRYSKSIPITIITNGSHIDEDISKVIKNYEIQMSISIDGFKSIHNKMRKYPSKKGTFDDVIKGISILKELNINIGCSCTIGNHNLDSLKSIIKFFQDRLNIEHGMFNFVQFGSEQSISSQDAAYALIEAFDSTENKNFSFNRVYSIISRIINKKPINFHCNACGEMLAIMPNGDISLCHRSGIKGETILGNILQEDLINSIVQSDFYTKISKRSSLIIPECLYCDAISICGGGCYMNAYEKTGNYFSNDKDYCNFIKTILNWILERILNWK